MTQSELAQEYVESLFEDFVYDAGYECENEYEMSPDAADDLIVDVLAAWIKKKKAGG